MQYRYLTTNLTGCVQQLACNILPHGYWFYCMGRVPDKKDPFAIDAKLLGKYGIEISRLLETPLIFCWGSGCEEDLKFLSWGDSVLSVIGHA